LYIEERCTVMQKQTVRQQARARAREARAKVLQEQAKRERRLAKCGETVAVALAERDAVVTNCEQRAGQALRSLIEEEGLSTQEALAWCGNDTLTGREVYRLIRSSSDAAQDEGGDDQDQDSRQKEPAPGGQAASLPG
jgi:hypothetical protein